MGFKSAPSEANFVMVDIRRGAKEFQDACRAQGVLVGRPFPPLLSQTRISIGTEDEIRKNAFAMPFTSPAYPVGPYRFVNREFMIITYRTDMEKLRAVVPAPLEVTEPLVKYEFIRMPDSTGFGDTGFGAGAAATARLLPFDRAKRRNSRPG